MTCSFDASIEANDQGGAYIAVPFDVEAAFGSRGQVRVQATFDGVPYRGSIAPMGGKHILIVRKAIREAIGKGPGDRVYVTLEEDTTPRVVDVPDDLVTALARRPGAKQAFDGLAYTHKKEYVAWIEEAKRAETRARRIAKAAEMLENGKKLR